MIFPPNAPVLGHVFWKYFRKFLNQQAFKFLQTKIAVSKKHPGYKHGPSKEPTVSSGPPKGMQLITGVSAVKVFQGQALWKGTRF